MAKTSGGPNKSAAIREYLATNPEAKPKEIVEAMKSQGINVSTAFVSTVKSNSSRAGGKKKARRTGRPKTARTARTARPTRATRATRATVSKPAGGDGGMSVDQLIKAKRLADELGGVAKARATLEALDKIVR